MSDKHKKTIPVEVPGFLNRMFVYRASAGALAQDKSAAAVMLTIDDYFKNAGDGSVSIADCLADVRRKVPACSLDDEALSQVILERAVS